MGSMQNKQHRLTSVLSIFALVMLLGLTMMLAGCMKDTQTDDENLKDEDTQNSIVENQEPTNEEFSNDTQENEPEPEETYIDIRIAAAGDIMVHSTQITSAYDDQTGTYNFKPMFEDVRPILSEADLAIANFETTTAGPSREYAGYPAFNSPDEVIDAIKYAGIDVLTTANNHSLDTGRDGLKRTVNTINEKGIDTVGTYAEVPDTRVLLKDVKGIKLAIISYTESTNGIGDQYPPDELHAMLNMMEKDHIIRDIQSAKDLGADFIIAYMHWGTEYMEEPNEKQVEYAYMMAEEGVDLILGSHPHVIQRSEVIETAEQETFVIYSMGNFISNQRMETLGEDRQLTEDGVIVNIDIRKNEQTNETTIEHVEYVPTWVYRHKFEGDSKYTYRILPIEQFLLSDEISEAYKQRMQRSLDATVSKMYQSPAWSQ